MRHHSTAWASSEILAFYSFLPLKLVSLIGAGGGAENGYPAAAGFDMRGSIKEVRSFDG
jgi:hypothetical protein